MRGNALAEIALDFVVVFHQETLQIVRHERQYGLHLDLLENTFTAVDKFQFTLRESMLLADCFGGGCLRIIKAHETRIRAFRSVDCGSSETHDKS